MRTDDYPDKIDGVDLFPDVNAPGGSFYDLNVPHLVLGLGGTWKKNYWRQIRAGVPLCNIEQPTVDDLRGYCQTYEEVFGHRPAHILMVQGPRVDSLTGREPPRYQWGLAIQGPHDPREYDWESCEWCGTTERKHNNPCPRPPAPEVHDDIPIWFLPVLAEERDRLIGLLDEQREPWAKELRRRLAVGPIDMNLPRPRPFR